MTQKKNPSRERRKQKYTLINQSNEECAENIQSINGTDDDFLQQFSFSKLIWDHTDFRKICRVCRIVCLLGLILYVVLIQVSAVPVGLEVTRVSSSSPSMLPSLCPSTATILEPTPLPSSSPSMFPSPRPSPTPTLQTYSIQVTSSSPSLRPSASSPSFYPSRTSNLSMKAQLANSSRPSSQTTLPILTTYSLDPQMDAFYKFWIRVELLLKKRKRPHENSRNDNISRIFMHYHKTGHDLSGDFMIAIENETNFEMTQGAYLKRHGTCAVKNFTAGSFFIQTAPNYFCNLTRIFPKNTRIVHMVRDSYDHIISSFLYHRQIPTPEIWVTSHNPCTTNAKYLHSMRQTLGLDRSSIKKIIILCERLNKMMPNQTFYHRLRNLPLNDSIRLEAARFLISNGRDAGGDILRLPNNILRLRESNAEVLTVGMNQWYQNGTIDEALQFLFGDSIEEKARKNVLNHVKNLIAKPLFKDHLTKGRISQEEKEWLKSVLKNDTVLGPVLKRVSTIVSEEISLHHFK